MLSCTNSRDPAMQVCPVAAKIPAIPPETAAARSASGNTIWADFPPSSKVSRLKSADAFFMILRPAPSPPVKATLATFGWMVNGSPTSLP